MKKLSRRNILKASVSGLVGLSLAGCNSNKNISKSRDHGYKPERLSNSNIPHIEGGLIVHGDTPYLFGGNWSSHVHFEGEEFSFATDVLEVLDPDKGWLIRKKMPETKSGFGCFELNGNLHAIAGARIIITADDNEYRKEFSTSVLQYSLNSDTWKQLNDFPIQTEGLTTLVHEEMPFAFGGRDDKYERISQSFRYNTENDEWRPIKEMPFAVENGGAVSYDGKIFIFGGVGNDPQIWSKKMQVYDPKSDNWEAQDMKLINGRIKAFVHDDQIKLLPNSHFLKKDYMDEAEFTGNSDNNIYSFQPRTKKWKKSEKIDVLYWFNYGDMIAAQQDDTILTTGFRSDGMESYKKYVYSIDFSKIELNDV